MSEFLFPTYREWLQEYKQWSWDDYDRARWDPSTIFSHVSPLVREVLSLPAQRDYYRPERAALFLETLYDQPPPMKHGMLVFATWMVQQADIHRPTSLMGAEICRGMRGLYKELGVPRPAKEELEKLLVSYKYMSMFEPCAEQVFSEWLRDTEPTGVPPLAAWLRREREST